MERNPITPGGYEVLVEDLRHQKSVVRPQIVRDIEEARAHGDISENSEFEDAKERQAHCEGRIRELEHLVATADIIDPARIEQDGRVKFGATVVVTSTTTGDESTWTIVGVTEADASNGKISYKAPMARALIGREEGEEVIVPAPGGKRTLEIRYDG
jgi:transcription elongation factor GreA